MGPRELVAALLLIASPVFAEDHGRTWGCLWIDGNEPGEQLVQWCVLNEGIDEVPCYDIEADQRVPAEGLDPWVIVPAVNITARLEPNEGLCPRLPADMPPIDSVRGGSSTTKPEYTPIQVFFGTDREIEPNEKALSFGGRRARDLQLGKAIVTVPKRRDIGEIGRPWSISLFGLSLTFDEDPARHFIMHDLAIQDRDSFAAELKAIVDQAKGYEDQAFVFVHGFNVTFEEAAWRTAQIAYDLQFDGAPIFYSWPSKGNVVDYEYDQNSARQSRTHLQAFLELVRAESGAEIVHLIGHSMGANPLMEVLVDMWKNTPDPEVPLFNQIVLAAADIDRDVYLDLAEQVQGAAKGITLYASAKDRAMKASRAYAGGVPRVGDIAGEGPTVHPNVDTIDATALSTDFFGLKHSDYADHRILLNDIGLLIKQGLRPPAERTPSLLRIETNVGVYWKYPP